MIWQQRPQHLHARARRQPPLLHLLQTTTNEASMATGAKASLFITEKGCQRKREREFQL